MVQSDFQRHAKAHPGAEEGVKPRGDGVKELRSLGSGRSRRFFHALAFQNQRARYCVNIASLTQTRGHDDTFVFVPYSGSLAESRLLSPRLSSEHHHSPSNRRQPLGKLKISNGDDLLWNFYERTFNRCRFCQNQQNSRV